MHVLAAGGKGLRQVPDGHDRLRRPGGGGQLHVDAACSSADPASPRAGSSVRSGPARRQRPGAPHPGSAARQSGSAARICIRPSSMAWRRQETGDRVQPAVVLTLALARDAAQQAHRVRVPGLVEQLPRRTFLDQLARIQHADPIAHFRDHGQVVADEQQRGIQLRAQPGDKVQYLGLNSRVQGGRGLVQDQQRRLGRQRHGDDNALRHAARQLVRVPLHDLAGVGDLNLAQHRLGPLQRLGLAEPGHLIDLGHLPPDPNGRVQRLARLLVDHGYRLGSQLAELGRRPWRADRGRRSGSSQR